MRRQTEDDMNVRRALRALPLREPPAAVWERIGAGLATREAAAGGSHRWYPALAASLALCTTAALFAAFWLERSDDAAIRTAATQTDTLAALVAESARLERTLVALPRFTGVVRAGTVSTITGLEDQIAWIDAELTASEAFGVDPVYRQALWQERVEMMTALIDVQYAQLPATMLIR